MALPISHSRPASPSAVASAAGTKASPSVGSGPDILPRPDGVDFSSAPPDLMTLANNSLFTHWRPKAHFIAPNSWMNDPMTLWYKADGQGGGKFKASYQAYPNHVQWGHISQASAVSDDLIHWKDVPSWEEDRSTLSPSQVNDRLGVFDGTMISKGYKGFPTLIYTGVKHLPTGWRIPYTPGAETQNLAWTEDGGVSWHKLESNPVIGGPPAGMNITAFRDPWLFQSPTLEKLTASNAGVATPPTTFNGSSTDPGASSNLESRNSNGSVKDPWFATVSGGEKDVGPHLLLYRQASEDFTKWVYLGQVFQHERNYSWSEWSGNWGFSLEASTVLRLGTEGDQPGAGGRDFITMGTEGGRPEGWADHWPLWVRGNYSDQAQMVPEYAGVTDWGETYAFMSFPAPRGEGDKDYKNQPTRQILFGWVYEDDKGHGLLAKGWQGSFTLPREMFVKRWTVQDSRADDRGSWGVVARSGSTATLETLGTRPAEEVKALMSNANSTWSEKSWTYSGGGNGTWAAFEKQPKSRFYALSATVSFNASASDVSAGFTIFKSPDGSEETSIYYDFAAETIRVDRSKSSLVTGFNLAAEAGKMRLWHVPKDGGNGTRLESLKLTIFVDNSVVEIYANDVFAMTTRVYPWRTDSLGLGYYISGTGSAKFSEVKVWEGLTNAWPDRPTNSSGELVCDEPGSLELDDGHA